MKKANTSFQKTTLIVKKYAKKIIENIKVKYLSLTIPKQIVLIGILLGIASLFFPWIQEIDQDVKIWNAFTPLSGNIGYILIVVFILLAFLILSTSYRQKVKMYSGVNFTNHIFIIISGIGTIFLGIIALSFAVGLGVIGQNMNYGNGPIFTIISGILITAGGILIRSNYKKNSSEIILEEMSKNREEKAKKENMELPI